MKKITASGLKEFRWHKLSFREQLLIVVTGIVGLGFLFYQFDYRRLEQEIQDQETLLSGVEASLRSYRLAVSRSPDPQSMTRDIEKVRQENARLEAENRDLQARLRLRPLDAIQVFQSEAERRQIRIQSFRTHETQRVPGTPGLKAVSLILKMDGEFPDIQDFLKTLSGFRGVMKIQSLGMTRYPELYPRVQTRLHLKIYVL